MRICTLILLFAALGQAVVVDRVAIIAGDRAIKTSDIEREVRITQFINGEPLNLGLEARKKAADRLIDQAIIRREIAVGRYPEASADDVDRLLKEIRTQRYQSEQGYRSALASYGITEQQLRRQLLWQLTVLQFVEARFRPGVLVSEEEIGSHYRKHYNGKPPLEQVRQKIEDELAGGRVNEQFYSWLEQSRKDVDPEYIEGALK